VGEDGTVQSILDLMNVPYSGSGVLASSLAMDKFVSKIIMKEHGVKVPDDFLVRRNAIDYEKNKKPDCR